MKKRIIITVAVILSIVCASILTACVDDKENVTEKRYSVSVEYDTTGGTIEGVGEYKETDNVTITAIANAGYVFAGWYRDNELVFADKEYTFTMPAKDVEYEARWATNKYNVVINTAVGGSVTGVGSYQSGERVTIMATALSGYTFNGWYQGGALVSSESCYTFVMPAENVEYEARWSANGYALFIKPPVGGSVKGAGIYQYNDRVVLSATTDNGYTFDGWYIDDKQVSIYPDYTFPMPAEDIECEARWIANKYDIKVITGQGGSVIGAGQHSYKENVTLTAVTNEGYSFVGWYKDDTLISTNIDYTFVMPTEDMEYEARWNINSYQVEATSTIGGSITGAGIYEYNSTINLIAMPETDYIFIGWYVDDELVSADTTYSFTMPAENLQYEARFVFDENKRYTYVVNNNEATITGFSSSYKNTIHANIPAVIDGYNVTSIGTRAFYNCNNLLSITIPDGTISIEESAFGGCSRLESIEIPDSITNIGNYAFDGCNNLQYNEKNGVKYIGNQNNPYLVLIKATEQSGTDIFVDDNTRFILEKAFYNHSTVKNINIPNNVIRIGNAAFYNCTSLVNVNIPTSLISIGVSAFNSCSSLASINIPNTVTQIEDRVFEGCSSLTRVDIPNSITSIGKYAFARCSSLLDVKIPNSVTSIGDGAFAGCNSLINIDMPDSVTKINTATFDGCTNLTSIIIPPSIKRISSRAFDNCLNLKKVYITDIKAWCSIEHADNPLRNGGELYINGELVTELVIPNNVEIIEYSAFYGCGSIQKVVIPDTVTRIGRSAFARCENLTSITIPFVGEKADGINNTYFGYIFGATSADFNDVVPKSLKKVIITGGNSISYNAFSFCYDVESIDIPDSVTSIGGSAFSHCRSLTSIDIPNSVTSIDGAFQYCSSLTSIKIPDGVTRIGDSAFHECRSLTSIDMPDSVTSIGESAFRFCSSLTSIELPDSVTSIGDSAFRFCRSLTSIDIPSNVTNIGSEAFYGCENIEVVNFEGSITKWRAISKESHWNLDMPLSCRIICTDGVLDLNGNNVI